jgi:hypothetical protein
MKMFVGGFMTFMGGFVACANLSRLMSVNPDYEAAWWKAAMAVVIAIAGVVVSRRRNDHSTDTIRWRHYASSPQTALMMGSELDPNDQEVDWLEECNRLADAQMEPK